MDWKQSAIFSKSDHKKKKRVVSFTHEQTIFATKHSRMTLVFAGLRGGLLANEE